MAAKREVFSVDIVSEDRAVRLDAAPGTIVAEERPETADVDRDWTDVDLGAETVEATSTVRLTGRDGVTLLRDALPTPDPDEALGAEAMDLFGTAGD